MAETMVSMQQSHDQNPTMQSLFHALDPISLILSQNPSDSEEPQLLKLTTESFYEMERGPRYGEYAELRERKLRMKSLRQCEESEPKSVTFTPPLKKQVKFQQPKQSFGGLKRGGIGGGSGVGHSALVQSVPDFSSVLRKENRKPTPTQELTPPPPSSKNWAKVKGVLPNSGGSKSANCGEKKCSNGGFVARKSYATLEELKGLSFTATSAINGDNNNKNRVGKNRGDGGKTTMGHRKF